MRLLPIMTIVCVLSVGCNSGYVTPTEPAAAVAPGGSGVLGTGAPTAAASSVAAAKESTRLLAAAVSGKGGQTVTIPVTLTSAAGVSIRGAALRLTASKNEVTAETDRNGTASFSFRIPSSWSNGPVPFTVRYAGSSTYRASETTSTITVGVQQPTTQRATALSVASMSVDRDATVAVPVTLSSEGRPLGGIRIETRLNSNVESMWKPAATNAEGVVNVTFTNVFGPGATVRLEARFAGTATFRPSSAVGILTSPGSVPPVGSGTTWTVSRKDFSAAGGTGLLLVSGGSPEWQCVASNASWVVLPPVTTTLRGPGSVEYAVMPNRTGAARSAEIYTHCPRMSGHPSITIKQGK